MAELTNTDIDYFAQRFGILYNGTYCKDELASLKRKNGGYVINLDNSNLGGSHWVSLYIKDKNAVYADPFGIIYPIEVEHFCRGLNLSYSTTDIQNINQKSCGWYCIAFLYAISHSKFELHKALNIFLSMFNTENTKKNDRVLKLYLQKII